eukprot:27916-Amphidinium_carterae.1
MLADSRGQPTVRQPNYSSQAARAAIAQAVDRPVAVERFLSNYECPFFCDEGSKAQPPRSSQFVN